MTDTERLEEKIDKVFSTLNELEIHVREKIVEHSVKIETMEKDINGIGNKIRGIRSIIITGFGVIGGILTWFGFLNK